MSETEKPLEQVTDYVTGEIVPNIGAEANRQAVERFLVEEKGWQREQIKVDAPFEFTINGILYPAVLDLLICCQGRQMIAIKCCAGSLLSREREILAAARVCTAYQVPYAIVCDGLNAIVMDTLTGEQLGQAMSAIPARHDVENRLGTYCFRPLAAKRSHGEKLIFRSYDSMNINVRRRSSVTDTS